MKMKTKTKMKNKTQGECVEIPTLLIIFNIMKNLKIFIVQDEAMDNPRDDFENLWVFYTRTNNYICPDQNHKHIDDFSSIVEETEDSADNAEEHAKLILKEWNKQNSTKMIYCTPVSKYEHGSVTYSLGVRRGFDYGVCGFYAVFADNPFSFKRKNTKKFEEIIAQEIDIYNKWGNGEVYWWSIEDENGNYIDGCGWYYDIEEAKEDAKNSAEIFAEGGKITFQE